MILAGVAIDQVHHCRLGSHLQKEDTASSSQLLRSVSPASVSSVHSVEDEPIKMQQAEHQARLVFMEAEHKAKMRVLGVEYQIAQVNLQKAMASIRNLCHHCLAIQHQCRLRNHLQLQTNLIHYTQHFSP